MAVDGSTGQVEPPHKRWTAILDQLNQYRNEAQRAPLNPNAQFNHGWAASRAGLWQEAMAAYERALDLSISDPEEVYCNIALIYSEQLGRTEAALNALTKALGLNPSYYPAHFNRAHLYEQLGDRDLAVAGFLAAADLEPHNPQPIVRAADASPLEQLTPTLLTRLTKFAEADDIDALFALAKIKEQRGNTASAWDSLTRANTLDAKDRKPWPIKALSDRLFAIAEQPLPRLTNSNGPVFIAGMFRTGSTLLEQILAAHGAFSPLGESEFWPRRIAAMGGGMVLPARGLPNELACRDLARAFEQHSKQRISDANVRVTDKRPDNIYHIALIARVLPNARFIITERDWRDTLLSVWGTRLHPQHGYASDLEGIRQQLRLCQQLAYTCQQQAPDRVYRLCYESLVEDPEATLRHLLAWLGESWDPKCLTFHEQRNAVRTASVWQVREPLHSGRRDRWRRYEPQLRSILGATLDQSVPAS